MSMIKHQQSPLQRGSGEHLFFNAWPNSAFPSSTIRAMWKKRSLFPSFSPLQKLNKGPAYFCPVSQELQFIVSSSPEGKGKGQKQGSRCCIAFLSRCMNKTCLVSWSWCYSYSTHALYSSGAPKAVASFSYLHIRPLDILLQPRSGMATWALGSFKTSTVRYCLY